MNVEPPQLKQHDFALLTEDQETKDSFTYKESEGTSGVVEVDQSLTPAQWRKLMKNSSMSPTERKAKKSNKFLFF